MAKRLPTTLKIQLGAIGALVVIVISLLMSQSANPDFPPLFSLKRIQEKAYLSLKTTPQSKVDYMRNLLNTRLEELSNQVNSESYDYILPSAQRYSTLAGQITELVISNNMKDEVKNIKEQFSDHLKTLNSIYVKYPKNTDNKEYKYIEDDINYLKIYSDKLNSSK
jgi:hypothetical protein